ncbi:hypothetical protein AB0I69_20060 [Streptomyces sp. NPDC050508]|uniref:hypothetical protein n=1 Tax=Streptomyces sp. NPDC050508 TaxID=3155405 RepID=UPI0034379E99
MTTETPEPARPTATADGANAFVRMTGSGDPEDHLAPGQDVRPWAADHAAEFTPRHTPRPEEPAA